MLAYSVAQLRDGYGIASMVVVR